MNGNARDHEPATGTWYRLRDEMTGQDKGFIAPDGTTRGTDEDTAETVRNAFSRDLITKQDEVVEELGGVCFDGVCTIGPSDPAHNQLVLRNLGALTGLRPERVDEPDEEAGRTHPD